MNLKSYQKFVKSRSSQEEPVIVHALFGLATEVGELINWHKRAMFYGDVRGDGMPFEELGDILFYSTMLANEYGYTLDGIVNGNVKKLTVRYRSGKFTKREAIKRADKAGGQDESAGEGVSARGKNRKVARVEWIPSSEGSGGRWQVREAGSIRRGRRGAGRGQISKRIPG